MGGFALMGGIAQVPCLQKDEWTAFYDARAEEPARIETAKADQRDLNRMPHEPLYLMVKKNDKWRLPRTTIQENELLHEAADRMLGQEFGSSDKKIIEAWRVGEKPIAVLKDSEADKVVWRKRSVGALACCYSRMHSSCSALL